MIAYVSMSSALTLFFLDQNGTQLDRSEFASHDGSKLQVSRRGKMSVPTESHSTFQWTSAVHALAILFVRHTLRGAQLPDGSTVVGALAGRKGSPAMSLDYALEKMPLWLSDMFGLMASGEPLARYLLRRLNPSAKRPGPVVVFVNHNRLPSEAVKFYLDGVQVLGGAATKLLSGLESSWDPGSVSWQEQERKALGILQLPLDRGVTGEANEQRVGGERHELGSSRELRQAERTTEKTFTLQPRSLEDDQARIQSVLRQRHSSAASQQSANPYLVALSAAWELASLKGTDQTVRVRACSSEAEVRAISAIDHQSFGTYAVPAETLLQWWHGYNEGIQVLYFGDKPVGAVGIWPLDPTQREEFVHGQITEFDLRTPCAKSGIQFRSWYVAAILLIPTRRNTRSICALLQGAFRNWLAGAPRDYPLEVFALGYSSHGRALLERFRFRCVDRGNSREDHMPLYRIEFSSEEALTGRWESESFMPTRPLRTAVGF